MTLPRFDRSRLWHTRLLIPIWLGLLFTGLAVSPLSLKAQTLPGDPGPLEPKYPKTPMGILVGEVTPFSAIVQLRLCRTDHLVNGDVPGMEGEVEFTVQPITVASAVPVNPRTAKTLRKKAVEAYDYIARVEFTGLRAGTTYLCRTRIASRTGEWTRGPQATFRTLPGPAQAVPVTFAVVTGMNYAKFHGDSRIDRKRHLEQNNIELPAPYQGPDKELGYPALKTLRREKPHFFIGTGDNVYYDTPVEGRAKTLKAMRRKWHEQFVQPRYRSLFEVVPTYWEVDDHDYRKDDCDNTGDYDPSPELAQRVMWEQLPYGPHGSEKERKTYRTYRVSRDLQIWLLEGRIYRSPNAMPDGPGKSIWGQTQRAWLQETLRSSDATFKIIVSPTPLIGPDDLRKTDNHCDIGGFRHERDAFFRWLRETGLDRQHVYFVCGDRHWQYHSIDPTGLQEFSCGALVDANARLGRKPGDPKSTDPDATIRQVYTQKTPSGGFLLVTALPSANGEPAKLRFEFCDEHGKRLYVHEIQE